MAAGTFMAFAYGSNMLTTRLRDPKRCPSATPIGVAELEGCELRWHKRSTDGSGKCDIVAGASAEARVFGVLYQIATSEKQALDKAEGLGKGYKEIDVEVVCNGRAVAAKAYQGSLLQNSISATHFAFIRRCERPRLRPARAGTA